MTATMEQAAVAELAQAAAQSMAAALGVDVAAGVPVSCTEPAAVEGETVALRSQMIVGDTTTGLVTIVPASGLSGSGVDAPQLAAALAAGVGNGITELCGTPAQVGPTEPAPPTDGTGLPYEFDLTAGAETVKIQWVVEASLGILLSDGDPVDPPVAEGPSVAPATLPELTPSAAPGRARDLQLLADVPMNVTVEVGRGSVQVRELLSLVQGSIVELDRVVGAPVDVLVNGSLVAHGDIVLVGDDLGVRITEIVEQV